MSILAGFVEPGRRSSRRWLGRCLEVGIAVQSVDCVADQPWPFPSLMIGFTARRADRARPRRH